MVVFISAGLSDAKKTEHPFARLHLYLNYGLLGLATIVAETGLETCVFHGDFATPADFVARRDLLTALADTEFPVFISLPSGKAIPWAVEFLRLLKELCPEVRVVVGGRWVLREDVSWLRPTLAGVDLFVFGTAERRIISLLRPENWDTVPYTDRTLPASGPELPLGDLPDLNYRLLAGYPNYTTSLEVSRGCGMGCSFCLERNVPLQTLRTPANVVANLDRYAGLFGPSITPYFECSFFRPPATWITELADRYKAENLPVRWRTESRVDSLTPSQVERLAASGLKVIDLGLESASASQLLAMHKTTRPDVYLRKADELLRACAENGIWTKVNVLLYAGETETTLSETLDWLESRRARIKGLSVNPLVVYRDESTRSYLRSLRNLGARPVAEGSLEKQGFVDLHLSNDFDWLNSLERCLRIGQSFMTARDYFDLKSFSYFSRSLSWPQFEALVAQTPKEILPFRPN
jgi:hypothetical protein